MAAGMERRRSILLVPALLFPFLILLTVFANAADAATCPQTLVSSEAQTLLAAMDDLEDPQGVLEDWTAGNASEACCWTGVTCFYDSGGKFFRVQSLVLSGLDLNGTLPSAFGNLTNLSSIDLFENTFTGGIPESWAALSSLRKLNLGYNYLNGSLDALAKLTSLETLDLHINSFPQAMEALPVGNLIRLTSLDLSRNTFTGGIPESWASLSSLRKLNLGDNQLNGSLDALAHLTSLETLDLSSNLFSQEMEAVPVGSLTKLTLLCLQLNQFTGQFPTWLGKLSALTELHLDNNPNLSPSLLPTDYASWPPQLAIASFSSMNLYGPLPAALAQLPLQVLDLSDNSFNGSIPAEFGNFSSTSGTVLSLHNNNLAGELPSALAAGNFPVFDLHSNNLSGTLSDFFTALCGRSGGELLFSLDLGNNSFSGEIPPVLQNCNKLLYVHLNDNYLTGAIPAELANLKNLTDLQLHNNSLSGEIPREFSKLTSLESLTFSYNNISGSLPQLNCSKKDGFLLEGDSNRLSGPLPSFSDCPLIVFLSLQNNSLTGNLSVLANMSFLSSLSLSQNLFSGSLPAVEDWTSLTTLDLSLNNFTARIPASLGLNSPNMMSMNLSRNALTGDIPSTLFLSPSLLSIDLSYNNLTSPLDPSFLNSTSLTTFYLQGNQISGPLPDGGLLVANNLLDLDLSDNLLSGHLPSDFSVVNSINSLKLGNNAFYGAIPPSLAELTTLVTLNLSKNEFNNSMPNLLSQNLKVVDLSDNSFSGELPSFSGSASLLYMDLSSNNISGSIPTNYSLFSSLQHLDLSDNDLSGSLPEGLGDLSSLTFIDLSNNLLSGPLPANLSRFNASSFSGNAGLCGALLASPCAATPPPPSPSAAGDDGLSGGAIGGIAVGAAAGLLLLAVGVCLFVWRNKRRSSEDEELKLVKVWTFKVSPRGKFRAFEKLDFTIDDIVRSTNNFSVEFRLGSGGFGSVYKAAVSVDEVYAVKRLAQGSVQGVSEFRAEVETLGRIRHSNLIKLIASYSDPSANEFLLIYEFLSGGNLDHVLENGADWETRLNVAIGVARGLKYLHHDCIPYIIHRDMKPGNILMDEDMEAYVADFGLARAIDPKLTHVSTRLLGTIGYLAPEYASKGQASTKSDVYAYGVVILQLVSGKFPALPELREGISVWAKVTPFAQVVDSTLDCEGEHRKQMLAMLKLGIACTSRRPQNRPSMDEVLHALEHLDEFAVGIKEMSNIQWAKVTDPVVTEVVE